MLLAVVLAAASVITENPHLQRAVGQLENLDEAGALKTLEKARSWPKNSPHDLALVHLYLGLAHAGLSHGKQAVEAFQSALLLENTLTLPGDASPRIREWWKQAGGKEPEPEPPPAPAPVPVVVEEKPAPALTPKPAPLPAVVVAPPPPEPAPRSRTLPAVLIGGGIAFLAGGAGFVAYSLSVASAYRAQQPVSAMTPAPTVSRTEASTVQVLYPLSFGLLAVGALLVVLGLIGLLG